MKPLKRYLVLIAISLGTLTITFNYLYTRENAGPNETYTTTTKNVITDPPSTSTSKPKFIPNCKFQNYVISPPETFAMKDDDKVYFQTVGKMTCFVDGTDWEATLQNNTICSCLNHWYGKDCGVPEAVWKGIDKSSVPFEISRRARPRRIVNAINVNHETEMLEGRVHELGEVVDVYLIGESNYTAYGTNKSLHFLQLFRTGFLCEFQSKFVYVFQNVFPAAGLESGWVADDFQRTFLSTQGLKQLQGLRPDDIYLQSDADEIPKREVLLFLKLYDHYLEPIVLSLTWTIYGFFWWASEHDTRVNAACSIQMLETHFDMNGMALRRGDTSKQLKQDSNNGTSNASSPIPFSPWMIGSPMVTAGWHCSWCFLSPEGIRTKLISAQIGDKPRWGDYPEKTKLDYLRRLIETGTWFDNTTTFETRLPSQDYAPKFYMSHLERFRAILTHPTR